MPNFLSLAIQACLDFAKVRPEAIDEVCLGWQPIGQLYRHDLSLYATGRWPLTYLNFLNSTRYFASMWHQGSGAKRFMQRFGAQQGAIPLRRSSS